MKMICMAASGFLPDLLAQVRFGILAELAFPTLRDIQGYDRIPLNKKQYFMYSVAISLLSTGMRT